eukprot:13997092-Ditylum_brightwellii.AAC.1
MSDVEYYECCLSGIPTLLGESGMGIDPVLGACLAWHSLHQELKENPEFLEHPHFSDHSAYPTGICGWGASKFSALL